MKHARHLLLDDRIVARRVNAALTVTEATKCGRNPLFLREKPWEVDFNNGYPNVILDPSDGLYKCWYHAFVTERSYQVVRPEQRKRIRWVDTFRSLHRDGKGPVRTDGECYATSRDGLVWRKPALNRVSFQGSRRNNIVSRIAHGPGVFFDAHETSPSKCYKMFTRAVVGGRSVMAVGFSPDGVRWRMRACEGIAARGDTHNNAFWAPTLGKYVGITRQVRKSKITGLVRQVARTISDDFVHWSKARVIFEGIEDHLQIYSMPVCYHAGLYIGLATILDINTDRAWPELAVSTDTVHWHRIAPGQPVIARGRRRSAYDWGCVYPSMPVFGDDAIRIYYVGDRGHHTDWRDGGLCLASLRPDGFAGYEPADRRKAAVVTTRPLRMDPAALRASADVRRGGRVTVVARDARSKTVAESCPIRRTGSDLPVRWRGEAPPADVRGPLRLEFRLHHAKLYSFSFAERL